ncbi:uncharacterized protein LOC144162224 [Haemaphysalis longicornis]
MKKGNGCVFCRKHPEKDNCFKNENFLKCAEALLLHDEMEGLKSKSPRSPTRTSRRQQGLPPELGLLPEKVKKKDVATSTMVKQANPPVVLLQPRARPSFRGSPGEDPEEWLQKLERVRIFNRWDDEETLRQVFFYLEDSARVWFQNHETSLTSWSMFETDFLKTFTTFVRKEHAELLLQTRIQHPNESVVVFVEELKMLFRRAHPAMAEEKKVRFLMRGVKQELFAGLIRNPSTTVAEFVTQASMIERTLDMRSRQHDRPLNAYSANPVNAPGFASDDLRKTIRAVAREERRKIFPTMPKPQVASLTDERKKQVT